MISTTMRALVGAGIGLTLAGCHASPPEAVTPELGFDLPDRWAAPAAAATGQIEDDWWRGFGSSGLAEAVATALEHNRNLRASAARLDAAAAQAVMAGAPLEPALDVGLDASRARRNFIGFPIPGGGNVLSTTTTTLGVSLELSWELDLWGRLRAGESAALADVQAAAADLAAARTSVAGQTCKAWFAAAEAGAQLALAERTLDSFRRTATAVRDRYRRGVRSALDAHLAAVNAANAEATVAQRREQLARVVRQLEILMGRYPAGLIGMDGPDDAVVAMPSVPAGLPADLLQRRPDLAAAERRLAASGARVDAARAALYPRLSLVASGGTSAQDSDDLLDRDFRVWSLLGNLMLPLWRGGALRADLARSQAAAAEALAHYADAVLRALAEVESALAAEADLERRERTLAEAAAHANDAATLARLRYEAGLEDFLALAESQRLAFQADSARLTARRLRLENRIDLFLALGGGFGRGFDTERTADGGSNP